VVKLFIGIIVIPIIGNAAEHFTAVIMAYKNKMDLSFEIAVAPVPRSLAGHPDTRFRVTGFWDPMNMMFNYYEIVVVALAVLSAQFISQDGESNWLKG
jgi:Ca2+:H+ antiporter